MQQKGPVQTLAAVQTVTAVHVLFPCSFIFPFLSFLFATLSETHY